MVSEGVFTHPVVIYCNPNSVWSETRTNNLKLCFELITWFMTLISFGNGISCWCKKCNYFGQRRLNSKIPRFETSNINNMQSQTVFRDY